jgi:hypothetical protein
MQTKSREAGSDTRVNVNTAHLVPAAAAWQAHKIIGSLCLAAVTTCAVSVFGGLAVIVISNSPAFNEKTRIYQKQHALCMNKPSQSDYVAGFYSAGIHFDRCERAVRAYLATFPN